MDTKTANRLFLEHGIHRADNPLSYELQFDFALQYHIDGVYKAIAALADWVGYETLRPDPLDVDAERERMAELRKTIEGLKNGTA